MSAWDRAADEPALWFDRFERYRTMGPSRTLEAVVRAEKGDKARSTGRWRAEAEKWRWRERAEAWDASLVAKARAVEEDELGARRKAWIAQAQAVQGKAVERLLSLDADELDGAQLLKFLEVGMKLELLARGQPDSIQGHSGPKGGPVEVKDVGERLAPYLDALRGCSGGPDGAVRQDSIAEPVDAPPAHGEAGPVPRPR